MNLKEMTTQNLVFYDIEATSKEEVISFLVDHLDKEGYISDKAAFQKAVLEREAHSATGMERGLAIPHGKSSVVNKAVFTVAKLKTPLAANVWESVDPTNQVSLVFLLAIPDEEAGTTHLKLLAELSGRLMNASYLDGLLAAPSKEALFAALGEEAVTENVAGDSAYAGKSVLAITACATGIAHTYMAAEALEQAGKELGIDVRVEKQGANGMEDTHDAAAIAKADAILFAVDTKVKEKERFVGKNYVEVKVADPLRHAKEILIRTLSEPDGTVTASSESEGVVASKTQKTGWKKVGADVTAAIMTGISYMIPLIVAAGLMLGIAKLTWVYALGLDIGMIGDPTYNSVGGLQEFLHYLDGFGNMLFKFIYPVFGMFVAYAIADRVGLIAGFAGGLFAGGLHYTFWGIEGGIPSGFLGALILGLTAGYVAKFLNQRVKLSKNLAAMKPMLIVPGISVLVIFILNLYVIDPVFGHLNKWIADTIASMSTSGTLSLSAMIAAATAFDLGGPVNKAAGAIAIGLSADGIFPLTPRVLAIVIPPLGIGLATIIDRFVVGRRVFSQDLRLLGNTSFLLGFLAISEGAIPFMLRNPLITIPLNLIGAIAGACTGVALGAVQWLPLPAIWGWPLVENLPAYLVGMLVGVAIIAFGNIFIRYAIIKRKERNGEKIDY
ncbi:PTS fructose transporter subunit IIABC [Listeria newyorkensis]|uniref:PTS fructose transporter subunit IIABC n=1 Tax=Listeria newyorkensis TaxID=1497681 RepID=A0ABX4XLI3_9LIST|nr:MULTISPECIES: fructose-specific PTS transporter subunit EIIC [Listeria]KGL38149.1 PTS fructose transporter subunit IIABC [Listeriaceae bacterium FSL A5-0209]KGL39299.1 PTS fructose transporter subunit IIABC [Listeria newyorkensis]PNP91978.1 PTS fructose transporter subunit IIABC [Listeria newyorkensis]RQW66115.1 PTS fructose transporter subunit IIABC [Listeria sp. SHR_NRA_18]WAO22246.1 fructose-specific PTS transporter subunit EIIC [Listeria newyorkensis]